MINLYNEDCLEAMRRMDTDQYDLAIVDPPYGMVESGMQMGGHVKGKKFNRNELNIWDKKPSKEYFIELLRVSKNQIIWGGNYFELPSTRCIICWDKRQPWITFSQIEIAWTSFKSPARLFKFDNRYKGKIHPTQKPEKLIERIIRTSSNPDDKVLDLFSGSGTTGVVCKHNERCFYGCEIDPDYYQQSLNRILRPDLVTMSKYASNGV